MRGRPCCAAFVILIALIGVLRAMGIPLWGERRFDENVLTFIENREFLSVTGTVDARNEYDDGISYLISGSVLDLNGEPLSIGSVMLYFKNTETDLPIGAEVFAKGKLSLYEHAANDGGFDAFSYYAGEDRYFRMSVKETKILSVPRFSLRRWTYGLRKRMNAILLEGAGERSGGVLSAMMLGDRSGISDETSLDYSSAGLSHLLAISGLHVSLIGMAVLKLLKTVTANRYVQAAVSVSFLLFYTLFTGARESTVRAFLMFAVMAAGKALLQSYDAASSLSAAGIIILIIRPAALFRAGFQFSFAASFGAALICPMLLKRIGIVPGKAGRIRGTLLSAAFVWISVQIATVPVMLWHFYEFPLLSILPNMVFVPLMSIVMLLGFAGAFAGMILPFLSRILLAVPAFLTGAMADAGAFLRNIPFYSVVTGRPHPVQILIYTAGVIFLIALLARQRDQKLLKKQLIPVLAAALFVFVNLRSGFTITALDVGQGDCLILQRNGYCFLIDAGSSSKEDIASDILIPYLKYNGITRIEAVYVTHADLDHISGVTGLLHRIEDRTAALCIEKLIMPGVMKKDEEASELILLGRENTGGVLFVQAGDRIRSAGLTFDVLWPDASGTGDRNEDSLVMTASRGAFKALFTGDIEETAEKALADVIPHCSLLKAAHHGSEGSSTEIFLESASPQAVFISCGKNNLYGHPHKAALERLSKTGAKIFITAERGQLTARIPETGENKKDSLRWVIETGY